MIDGSVNDKLEYAILATVTSYPDGEHQNYWHSWEAAVTTNMQGCIFTQDDLRWAFENLAQAQDVTLTKPDATRKYAINYSPAIRNGLADMDSRTFFMTGQFNVKITSSGAKHWSRLQRAKRPTGIGFARPR